MKPSSEQLGLIDSTVSHLTKAENSHPNQKADFYMAALRNVEKLSVLIKNELQKLQPEEPKNRTSSSECQICEAKSKSYETLPLGHYIPVFICRTCWDLNEKLKSSINKNLPKESRFKLRNFPA